MKQRHPFLTGRMPFVAISTSETVLEFYMKGHIYHELSRSLESI